MNYSVETLAAFERQAKRLLKKYPSLQHELQQLILLLAEQPTKDTPIGRHCYKIRLKIASSGKGKSGGGRFITHVIHLEHRIILLSIYSKTERENISEKEIDILLQEIL
jgi:hypothetical protein